MGFSFAKVFRLMSRGVIKQRAEVAVPGQPLPARVHGCPVKRFSSPNRPSPSPAAPHPPAPLGARVRAPVGGRILDAPGVPPSPRSRGEGGGEGALLHTAPPNSPPTP